MYDVIVYQMAHLAHEEECNISVMGRDYTIDLGTMQQVCITKYSSST